MSQKAQRRVARQKKVEVVWAGPAVVRGQRAVSRVPIGHRGATTRKALFEDSDGSDSAEQLPVVDESVSQQRRLKGLRKVQLWAWRQQVKDNVGVVKLCFQKWVGGGLAGWFVRNYARGVVSFAGVRLWMSECRLCWRLGLTRFRSLRQIRLS